MDNTAVALSNVILAGGSGVEILPATLTGTEVPFRAVLFAWARRHA